MDRSLAQILICPACLPRELPLRLRADENGGEDVLEGRLSCRECRRDYAVHDGIALLLVAGQEAATEDSYARPQALSAYLWSHFADLWDDADAGEAYRGWAHLFNAASGIALDAGCAVGRLTLEAASTGTLALGIDRSLPFIRLARQLARNGRLSFELTVEGLITEERHICLPERLRDVHVEFLVADALALPFPRQFFARAASLNLLDKVPQPRRHLAELDRVVAATQGALLVADPYSWSQQYAPSAHWLGGTTTGAWAGRAADNLQRILTTECTPPWRISEEGIQPWVIRNHARHFELIRSHFFLAKR